MRPEVARAVPRQALELRLAVLPIPPPVLPRERAIERVVGDVVPPVPLLVHGLDAIVGIVPSLVHQIAVAQHALEPAGLGEPNGLDELGVIDGTTQRDGPRDRSLAHVVRRREDVAGGELAPDFASRGVMPGR
ncbi:MAG: hypothetical protein L0206_10475, partial [Actinobacteria bacterium]|nr:hypothetical protein [Actinomycetota bacterium]